MKKNLRQQIIQKRAALTSCEILEKSKKIRHRLFHSKWYRNATRILFYVSFDNEVHTHEMIQKSLKNGKKVMVPKIDTRRNALLLSELSCWDDLCPGVYSILEPKEICVRTVPLSSVDLCIIPGVVFDCKGNRIGHGGGYYDRLLQRNCDAHRIGLAFELQIVKTTPIEPHDIAVERILTEKRTIICG